ncbi:hypothetical protein SMICM304S_01908 [Streptomyces microflavus]
MPPLAGGRHPPHGHRGGRHVQRLLLRRLYREHQNRRKQAVRRRAGAERQPRHQGPQHPDQDDRPGRRGQRRPPVRPGHDRLRGPLHHPPGPVRAEVRGRLAGPRGRPGPQGRGDRPRPAHGDDRRRVRRQRLQARPDGLPEPDRPGLLRQPEVPRQAGLRRPGLRLRHRLGPQHRRARLPGRHAQGRRQHRSRLPRQLPPLPRPRGLQRERLGAGALHRPQQARTARRELRTPVLPPQRGRPPRLRLLPHPDVRLRAPRGELRRPGEHRQSGPPTGCLGRRVHPGEERGHRHLCGRPRLGDP